MYKTAPKAEPIAPLSLIICVIYQHQRAIFTPVMRRGRETVSLTLHGNRSLCEPSTAYVCVRVCVYFCASLIVSDLRQGLCMVDVTRYRLWGSAELPNRKKHVCRDIVHRLKAPNRWRRKPDWTELHVPALMAMLSDTHRWSHHSEPIDLLSVLGNRDPTSLLLLKVSDL